MKKIKFTLWVLVGILLLSGFGVIAYRGMPVRQLENQSPAQDGPSDSSDTEEPVAEGLIFSLQEVQTHASAEDCWTVIEDQVYDLSSWVSRHPGGAQPILNLCGKDGTSFFKAQHERSQAAQSALALLKIGTLN